jgi:hypothetical protein
MYEIIRDEIINKRKFVCLRDSVHPVQIEHFFTDEELENVPDTLEKLSIILEIKVNNYLNEDEENSNDSVADLDEFSDIQPD